MSQKKPFHVYRHNPHILVFKFDNLGSIASKMWADFCVEYNGQMNPLRIVYDFVDCGPPSPYWIKNQNATLPKLIIPENTRTAYLIPHEGYRVWTDVVLRKMPVDVGPLRAFTRQDEAIDWLMGGLELPDEQPAADNSA